MSDKQKKSFFVKLKERKIIRVALVYLAVSWVIIQIGEASFEALILPEWSLALLMIIVFLGFPLALVLAFCGSIFAIRNTTVANAMFLFASAPFMAAGLGLLILKESVRRATWVAMAVGGLGVAQHRLGGQR